MSPQKQLTLIDVGEDEPERNTSTFISNMKLPVHRWFRYSAGFSAAWVESVIAEVQKRRDDVRVLDPFSGSATTQLAAENAGVESYGIESHPFVSRIANTKLLRQESPASYQAFATSVLQSAKKRKRSAEDYPDLITRCFHKEQLDDLDRLRCAYEAKADGSPESELTWLTLVSILRSTSHVGTAQWQYVLPNKSKSKVLEPFDAFLQFSRVICWDMEHSQSIPRLAHLLQTDARTCEGVPDGFANLVVTSPPYPNNYDYADSTRLEMMFMREIDGWSDLHDSVRQYLVRSCSQHTTKKNVDMEETLSADVLAPIHDELLEICTKLGEVRLTKGGKKNYHLMIASYFLDLARVWIALRRVCKTPCDICFVIGDSAPYGVYVPVYEWMGALAEAAGFHGWKFEKTRDRNIKWKNRKHRVPLSEGHLWVQG